MEKTTDRWIGTGVPERRWDTVPDLLRWTVDQFADREALVSLQERLSYQDLEDRSAALARGLIAAGISKYARVGLLMPNSPQWAVTWCAIARTGAVAVPLSTFSSATELRTMLAHADCAGFIIAGPKAGDQLEALTDRLTVRPPEREGRLHLPDLPSLQWIATPAEGRELPGVRSLSSLIDAGEHVDDDLLAAVQSAVHSSDPATMIYTSGSTSAPKGVVHSHSGVLTRVTEYAYEFSMRPDDRVMSTMPFFWVGGIGMILLPTLATGGCVATVERPVPSDVIDQIDRERLTRVFLYPPRTMATVMGDPKWSACDLSSVERGLPGLPRFDTLDAEPNAWNIAYTTHGDSMGLGMSETFAAYWWGAPDELDPRTPPLQRLSPGWEVKVINDLGEPAHEGEEGEVLVRGPSLTIGLQKVDRSDVFDADGFYRTGDFALVTDGGLRFRGRRGDLIKSAGANVAAEEVASALRDIDGVAEAFVVGVPDEDRGAVPGAAVVLEPGVALTSNDLVAALDGVLASYKIPRRILVVDDFDDIPMTPTGKLRQHELRAMLVAQRTG